MPSCVINSCNSSTGKDDHVILHSFPSDIDKITLWLLRTGQQFNNVEEIAQKIQQDNKTRKFRLCSKHFSGDSYIINHGTRILRSDACPSIFPELEEGELHIEESLKKARPKKPKRPCEKIKIANVKSISTEDFDISKAEVVRANYCSIGTQTIANLMNSDLIS